MRATSSAAMALVACAASLLGPRGAFAQVPAPTVPAGAAAAAVGRGVVQGAARDMGGRPILAAEVTIGALRAQTDSAGRYRIANVPSGRASVQARRLGYRVRTSVVEVLDGQAVTADVELVPLPQNLEPVVVSATMRPGARRMRAFYERRARGNGYFITREQLEPFDQNKLTDALRSRVPSVQVSSGGLGRSRLRLRSSRCAPLVWLDGAAATAGEFDLDVLSSNTIAAVEVYPGPASVPVEFRTPFGRDGCGGAIVIWSRSDLIDATDVRRENDNRKKRPVSKEPAAAPIQVYHADEVDQPAAVDSTRLAAPIYPDSLYAFSVNGAVTVEFVVDTTGMPMLETFGLVTATHPAFGESVRRAVAASRFHPARKAGRPVRQVMLLPFKFIEKQ